MTKLFRAGALATDNIADVLFFWATISQTVVDPGINVSHFRKAFGNQGYRVTAGKTLMMTRLSVYDSVVPGFQALELSLKIGYADNDVGMDTSVARVNPVMAVGTDSGDTSGMALHARGGHPGSLIGIVEAPYPIAIGGKFPFLRFVSVAAFTRLNFQVWAFEI